MADEQGQGQGTGQGGETGTGQGTPGQGQGTTAGTQGTGQGTQGVGAGTGQGTTGTQFTYTEDRSKWIPPHRFNEVSGKSRELEARLQERERQVAALTGNQGTPTEAEAKAAQTKEAFYKMFPFMREFEGMSMEEIKALKDVPQSINSTKDAESRQWKRHSDQQVSYIGSQVADALGSETLDADQIDDVRTTFSSWLKKKVNAELEASGGEQSPTLDKYENGDKKLLDEFSAAYTKRWVDPARRKAAAGTQTRTRPVPSSRGGQAVVSTMKRPEKFKDLDERLDFAVSHLKEQGVAFGRG